MFRDDFHCLVWSCRCPFILPFGCLDSKPFFFGGKKRSGNTQLTFIDVAFSVKTFWPFIMIGSCHKCRHGICVCECNIFLFVSFGFCGVSSSAVKKKKKRRPVTEVQEILIYLRVPHVCFCLSHSFLYTAVSRTAVNLRGCCGWFFEDKLCLCVFFLFFFFICSGWLWWVSVKDSLCCPP